MSGVEKDPNNTVPPVSLTQLAWSNRSEQDRIKKLVKRNIAINCKMQSGLNWAWTKQKSGRVMEPRCWDLRPPQLSSLRCDGPITSISNGRIGEKELIWCSERGALAGQGQGHSQLHCKPVNWKEEKRKVPIAVSNISWPIEVARRTPVSGSDWLASDTKCLVQSLSISNAQSGTWRHFLMYSTIVAPCFRVKTLHVQKLGCNIIM
jgi:hypothetical protein